MVGRWVDQDDKAAVVTECKWARNNNFLVRTFEVQVCNRIDMSGMQIIGWDPIAKQIQSWVFDSDGGESYLMANTNHSSLLDDLRLWDIFSNCEDFAGIVAYEYQLATLI